MSHIHLCGDAVARQRFFSKKTHIHTHRVICQGTDTLKKLQQPTDILQSIGIPVLVFRCYLFLVSYLRVVSCSLFLWHDRCSRYLILVSFLFLVSYLFIVSPEHSFPPTGGLMQGGNRNSDWGGWEGRRDSLN